MNTCIECQQHVLLEQPWIIIQEDGGHEKDQLKDDEINFDGGETDKAYKTERRGAPEGIHETLVDKMKYRNFNARGQGSPMSKSVATRYVIGYDCDHGHLQLYPLARVIKQFQRDSLLLISNRVIAHSNEEYHIYSSLPSKETLRGNSDSSFRGEGYIQCCVGVRLCDMYSNQELAEIHFMYGKADGNAALARRLHQERYPQRQCPDRKTFVRLHYRLCEYRKFNSPGLGRGRARSTTPEVQEEILEAVNMTPSISTRRVALQVNVPHTTVWRLLKEYQLYPYHLQRVQALSPADYPARVRFCQWFLQQCGVNPNFPALVLFTDEAQCTRDGITNFHNQHVWAYENPRATVPSHHQVRFSLNMWAGIIGDRLVGPHVLVNRLTGQAYTNFLENTIPHVLEDTPLINRQHIHFLHDGAPAHFSRTVRRYLDRRFPNRWIGRSGPIAWPPRSPDLNPVDFYLWGHLKSLVYSSPVSDLEFLRNRIVACSKDIRNTPGVWDRVRRSMRHRCEVCIQAGGGHFEHLLKNDAETDPKEKKELVGSLAEKKLKDGLEGMVNGTRVRGRRRSRMIDDIKICGSYTEPERKAENRKDWRKLGHVARMGESRNAYRVLVGRREGKRPLERQRRRWEDNIKMDLREVGYDGRDWINLAQDRDQWRAYVRAAMNLRRKIKFPPLNTAISFAYFDGKCVGYTAGRVVMRYEASLLDTNPLKTERMRAIRLTECYQLVSDFYIPFNLFVLFVLLILVLLAGVGKQGKPLQSDAREIVCLVHKSFEEELDALKNGRETISVSNVLGRTAVATGVSRRTVSRNLNQKQQAEKSGNVLSTPGKKRPNRTPNKTVIDSFTGSAIRRTIYNLYQSKFLPSLDNMREALKEAKLFDGSKWTLRQILKKTKFRYVKNNQGRKMLMHRSDVVVKRFHFLRKIREYRSPNSPIIYHEEMDGNIKNWFINTLLPNIPHNSVIVMDNASYHSVELNKAPVSSTKKIEMQAWLRYHNILYDPCYTKPVLYDIVKRSKDRFRTYEIDTVAVQPLQSDTVHTVLRLPPYHCDFNPIELIWTQVKSDVAKHNTDFKIRKTKELFEAALEKITPENWSSACEHVRYIEDFYRSKEGIVDELLDSFAINLEESVTGTDTDECEETDDISIFMEAGPSATGCMDGIAPLPQSP
ncbi:hypothetical protein ANN_23732 [Periplaneta americana]|uniref:Tc1-like transposase DDE domain-containing protein n=1 Tax=Periplaneta americana TaxID=6978 RepID=A0ABQ8SN52_PERAM|nr:hypothetical protein ANN_23732 [Periplaneta americana]